MSDKIHLDMRSTDGRIHLSGMTPQEVEDIEGMLMGVKWVRCADGRLQTSDVHQPLPDQTPDLILTPHWAGDREHDWSGSPDMSRVRNVNDLEEVSNCSASLIIQHITAGLGRHRLPTDYTNACKRLESYGFECLRSRRGRNGRFWELWFLPSLHFADGDLKATIAPAKDSGNAAQVREAVRFLCNCDVPWGTLDVCCQRACITFD